MERSERAGASVSRERARVTTGFYRQIRFGIRAKRAEEKRKRSGPPAPAAASYLDLSVVQGAEIAFGRLNETRGGLLEAHGGHGRAILAGLLTGGLRVWIFGGFFRALAALAHRRSGGRSRRSGDERAKFSSRERDGIGSDT